MYDGVGHIDVLSSGSSGNCLVLYDSQGKYIIVDVGIIWDKIAKGINYKMNDCVTVLVSHVHKDHVRSLSHLIGLGIPCYGNEDVCAHYKGCDLIADTIQIGGFKVRTFSVPHNVPNNAFVIDTIDNIRVLYVTDTSEAKQHVENVNCAIVEANWDAGVMFDNVVNDVVSKSNYNDHQSLDKCIEYLKQINNDSLNTVVLWHLSNTNINAQEAKERVQQEVGIDNVFIAKAGLTINLSK
jgi:phosphoribosyl 1,2-cyclic phosphodiesterase